MRHKVFGNQLGRNTKQARALYRSLVREVLDHGRIETTLAKAKSVKGMIDKVIVFAKKNTVSARRQVVKILGGDKGLNKLFTQIPTQFASRNSGFTRIIKLGQRFSDTTEKVILELVEMSKPVVKEKVEEKKVKEKKQNDNKTV